MHQAIEHTPLVLDLPEDGGHLVRGLHVEGKKEAGLQRSRELAHLGLEAALFVREIGNAELSACRPELLGNAPGD